MYNFIFKTFYGNNIMNDIVRKLAKIVRIDEIKQAYEESKKNKT